MKFKTFFQRRPAASHGESESSSSSPASGTTKRKKKDTKILTTSMKSASKPLIGISRASPAQNTAAIDSQVNCVQPQPDENSMNFMCYTGTACQSCGSSGRASQSDSGIADDTTMKLPVDLETPQQDKMEIDKVREDLEKHKLLLIKAQEQIKELSAELEKVKQENDHKEKEYGKMRDDFLLCIRSADRFREDAETKAEALEKEVNSLRKELSGDKSAIDSATFIISPKQGVENPLISNVAAVAVETAKVATSAPPRLEIAQPQVKLETGEPLVVVTPPVVAPVGLKVTSNVDNVLGGGKFPRTISKMTDAPEFKKLSSVVTHVLDSPKLVDSLDENMNKKRHEKLEALRKTHRGSLRNALLSWVKSKTANYKNVEITNFSTSWANGLALAALIHSLDPSQFDYSSLTTKKSKYNFKTALAAAEKLGLICPLNSLDMILDAESPPWEPIFAYVSEVYVFSS